MLKLLVAGPNKRVSTETFAAFGANPHKLSIHYDCDGRLCLYVPMDVSKKSIHQFYMDRWISPTSEYVLIIFCAAYFIIHI